MENIPWSNLSIKDIFRKLDSNPEGLKHQDAYFRLKKYGLNELKQKKSRSELSKFFLQFKNPLVYLLIISAAVTYFLKHNLDTIIILIIVFLNAIIGYFQERKAEKSLEALKKLMSLKAKIVRDGVKVEISSTEIVPGDIVLLEEGTKIPADLRLVESNNLQVDESMLTGESSAVFKNTELIKKEVLVSEQKNMVFSGTVVDSGNGIGVAVNTGKNTEFAKIAKEIAGLHDEITPLEKKLEKFSKTLLITVIIVCALIFILGIAKGLDTINVFLTAVAAAVAIIPEGLPAVITVTMAIGIHKMVKDNAIVKKMSAVETLGQITTIASDKTGTLTYNQMTLEKIFLGKMEINITGDGYEPKGDISIEGKKINYKSYPDLSKIFTISLLCNNASLIEKSGDWEILGDPTEGSLIVAAEKAGVHQNEIEKKYPRLDEMPFESKNQLMATLNQGENKQEKILAVKGSLEKILSLTKNINFNNTLVKIDKEKIQSISDLADKEAREGYRILALAFKNISNDKKKIDSKDIVDLIFLGFVAIKDPPREEVEKAIANCHKAGIKVIMVTGDFPLTAKSIAENLGIATRQSKVITGKELDGLTLSKIRDIVKETTVFARITPEMKLKIVEALQKDNQIVAVTGDGVNDAPILEQSDIGISMGQGGTDVAREASDMVLLDNNFATITNAIEEGRTIYQNIKRAIFFLLSTNAGEVLILLSALIIGLPMPLTPVQILWINLITDGLSGFALAMEPKHSEILRLKPRSPKEGIINKVIFVRILIVAITMTIGSMTLYYIALNSGLSDAHAKTIAFVSMALFQILNILNSRSFKTSIFKLPALSNKYITFSVIVMTILTILTAQLPLFQRVFGTESLSINEWISIIIVCLSVILVIEIEKIIRNIIKTEY